MKSRTESCVIKHVKVFAAKCMYIHTEWVFKKALNNLAVCSGQVLLPNEQQKNFLFFFGSSGIYISSE